MATRNNAASVIIKRKKVVKSDGHHGGAWKVAYADFVTAMMAFFMLMWLLNATTEKQRKGIADYFSPTIPINRISGGGDGAFGGDSVFAEDQMAQMGKGATAQQPSHQRQAKGKQSAKDAKDTETAKLEQVASALEQELTARSGDSMVSPQTARHIVTRVTDEGLIIEFFDLEDEPLFVGDTAQPTAITKEVAAMLTRVFGRVENGVALNGHVRAYPEMLKENPVWDLSTKRAQALRIVLEESGLPRTRTQRVTGFADRKLMVKNPMAARNNRMELILLRSDQ
ncbi:flagellar motor protein MotB [Phaeovulum sp.]|uniref:flagellar motor protein MotB n=1 Tax=Phaeovulum sp. TaxID=2934796 RepID=UPI0039E46FC0